jgi:hypothetical protein
MDAAGRAPKQLQKVPMKTIEIFSMIALAGACLISGSAHAAEPATAVAPSANPAPPPSTAPQRSSAELEKLTAPIALYPDPLVAIVLPAAAYPIEIVQAARFISDTNNIPKVKDQNWDENVKAVAEFPDVLKKMSDDLSWTVDLGQAFVDQPAEVMGSIQGLREKAHSFGALATTPQQIVTVTNAVVERIYEQQVVYVTNTIVQIAPANPQVIYVPTYNPTVIFTPPPPTGPPPIVTFGLGIAVGAIIANNCDWYYGGVYRGGSGVVIWGGGGHHQPYYPPPPGYRPPPYYPPPGSRPPPPGYRPPGYPPPGYRPPGSYPPGGRPTPYSSAQTPTQHWQPDSNRLNKAGASTQPATRQARGWDAPTTQPATGGNWPGTANTRPAGATQWPATSGTRPTTSPSTRPATTPSARPATPATRPASASTRPAGSSPTINRPAQTGGNFNSAFGGSGNRQSTLNSSARGASSRGASIQRSGGGGGRRR